MNLLVNGKFDLEGSFIIASGEALLGFLDFIQKIDSILQAQETFIIKFSYENNQKIVKKIFDPKNFLIPIFWPRNFFDSTQFFGPTRFETIIFSQKLSNVVTGLVNVCSYFTKIDL